MSGTAKVTRAYERAGRTLLDVAALDGEQRSRVRLLLPPGISAVPPVGSDLVLVRLHGNDQVVALGGDHAGSRITGLGPGEFGFRDAAGQQVVFKADGLRITNALKVSIESSGPVEIAASSVVVTAPAIKLGSAGATQPVKLANGSNAVKVFAE